MPKTPDETRQAMELVTGELPDASRRAPLELEIVEEAREADFLRRKVRFSPEPDDRCPAWLLIPHGPTRTAAGRSPAMLCLHQTTRIGKDEPAGLGGLPNLHYGRELAGRGYVAMIPDYPGFGEYACDLYARGYASTTMKGIWNHMRALDLLQALPEVDPDRIGCIGHSLGAHNALFAAAFEPRIRLVVSSCGFTRFTWNNDEGRGEPGDIRDWSHAGYMPRIAEVYGNRAENMPFDLEDVLAAIAPRPLFINAPVRDFFQYEGVDECVDLVRPLYGGGPAPDRLAVCHPDCEHDFPPEVRTQAYAWLDRYLAGPEAA